MDESVKIILKKLDDIDSRLKNLETPGTGTNTMPAQKVDRDPLFHKAVEAMDKLDEISSKQLSDALKIDVKRADAILDQLEGAGLGTCYMKDA